jgi:hypothetical protein
VRHGSRGRGALPAPTAVSPNLCRRTRLGRIWAVVLTKLGRLLGQVYNWSEEVEAIVAQVTVGPRESPPPLIPLLVDTSTPAGRYVSYQKQAKNRS